MTSMKTISQKKLARLCLATAWLLCTVPVFSQTAVQWMKNGETALMEGKLPKALRAFERAAELDSNMLTARRFTGVCYELMKDYPKALDHYIAVVEKDSLFSRGLYYQIGELCYKTGNYVLAVQYFERFQELQKRPLELFGLRGDREMYEETGYLLKTPQAIRACHIAMDSVKLLNVTTVMNIGGSINTKADEYFPSLTNDRSLLLYTRRLNKNADEDLFFSQMTDGKWQQGGPVVSGFNSNSNEGMSSLVRNGRRIFFTACGRPQVAGPCDIWEADLNPVSVEITNLKPVQGLVNSDRWESQVSVSCDGNTIYFASNRSGGLGGTDLWCSERMDNGEWGAPQNLGAKINTSGDEEAPFITNDGRTLYFSSTGHTGMGEQDIFVTWKDANGQWTSPVNLGPPVNTAYRELGFFLSADGQTGYFASDRPNGLGGMDIYFFHLSEQLYSDPITLVEGFVKDSLLGIPLQVTLQIDGRGAIQTDHEGRFFLCVKAGEILDIQTQRRFYHPYHWQFPIPTWDNRNFYAIDVLLQPESPPAVVVEQPAPALPDPLVRPGSSRQKMKREISHSVYFDFDRSSIETESVQPLNSFVQSLKDKEISRVNIVGFADDIGADVYNLKLSEERAKQVALYLIRNHIFVDQIFIEGKGSVRNSSGPREKNRRVDIRVTVME